MAAHSQVGTGYPVAPKVVAASTAAAVGGLVMWALGTYVFHGDVPEPVKAIVDIAVPGVLAFAAGWLAHHQYRDGDYPVVPPSPAPPLG